MSGRLGQLCLFRSSERLNGNSFLQWKINAFNVWLILLLVQVCSSLQAYDFQNEIKFTHLTVEDGLSQNSVHIIYQDQFGYIWLGTRDGLNRYDGYEMRIYKNIPGNPNSLSDNCITHMYEDCNGRFWVGTEKGINYLDRENDRFIPIKSITGDSNAREKISRIESIPGRREFVIQGNGYNVVYCNPDSLTFGDFKERFRPTWKHEIKTVFFEGVDYEWYFNLYEESRGKYVANIYRNEIGTDEFQDLSNPLGLEAPIYMTAVKGPDGSIWIGTWNNGMLRYFPSQNRFKQYTGFPVRLDETTGNCQSIILDASGTLWISTWGAGLGKYDPAADKFDFFHHNPSISQSLTGDIVKTLYQDRNGLLWVGTIGGGADRFNPGTNKFTHIRKILGEENALSSNSVYSIIEDSNGFLWIGTDGGGLNRFDRTTGKFATWRKDKNKDSSLRSNTIVSLLEDSKKRLWIGYWFSGLGLMDRETGALKNYYSQTSGFLGAVCRSIFEDRDGRIWFGTEREGLYRYREQTDDFEQFFTSKDDPINLSNIAIHDMAQDETKKLWLATERGLYRMDIDTEEIVAYSSDPSNPNSLSNEFIWDLHFDGNGILWIGTHGGGLCSFDEKSGEFSRHNVSSDQGAGVIYGILEDSQRNLWLSTTKGMYRYNMDSRESIHFDQAVGLQSMEFNQGAFFQSASGEMFFGGNNGLNAFHPDRLYTNEKIPETVITRFVVKGQEIFLEDDVVSEFEHNQNNLTFEFSALDYTDSDRNQYAFKLYPFDKDWFYADAQHRTARYTNLPSGDYIFTVKGSNNDGVWNQDGKSVQFNIATPYWKTWWFFSLLVIASGSLLYYIYHARVAFISRQRKRLSIMVNERTLELRHQTERLNAIFNNALVGIVITDLDGKYTYTNDKWKELLGQDPDITKTIFDSVNEDDIYSLLDLASHLTTDKIPSFQKQIRLINKDGEHFWTNLSASTLHDPAGDVRSMLFIIADIDQQKKNEELLQEMEKKNSALAMAVTANHELNQPLTVLQGNLEMLYFTIPIPDGKQKRYKKRITEAIEKMSEILSKYRSSTEFIYEKYAQHTDMVVFKSEKNPSDVSS